MTKSERFFLELENDGTIEVMERKALEVILKKFNEKENCFAILSKENEYLQSAIDGERYIVEFRRNAANQRQWQHFRRNCNRIDTLAFFYQYLETGNLPDEKGWEDVSEELEVAMKNQVAVGSKEPTAYEIVKNTEKPSESSYEIVKKENDISEKDHTTVTDDKAVFDAVVIDKSEDYLDPVVTNKKYSAVDHTFGKMAIIIRSKFFKYALFTIIMLACSFLVVYFAYFATKPDWLNDLFNASIGKWIPIGLITLFMIVFVFFLNQLSKNLKFFEKGIITSSLFSKKRYAYLEVNDINSSSTLKKSKINMPSLGDKAVRTKEVKMSTISLKNGRHILLKNSVYSQLDKKIGLIAESIKLSNK